MMGFASIGVVLFLLFLRGVCQAFHMPTVGAIVPSMVPRDKLSRINSLGYVFNGVVSMAGPVIAAILLAFLSIDQILWVDPATFLVSIAILLLIRIPSVRQDIKPTFRQDFAQGLSLIRRARGLLTLIFLATVLNFLLTPLMTLLPYFIRFDHFGNAGDLALVEAVLQGGLLVGGIIMLSISGFKRKIPAFIAACIIIFIGYAVVSFTPTGWVWFMAAAMLILGVPLPAANVSVSTIVQVVVPLEFQGRVGAVIGSLSSLATPLGMIMAGALAGVVGTANLFLGSALAGVVVLILAWLLTDVRHVEDLQATAGTAG
jgi:DHA3 family macrolide efflux protein-like MFS transporter